MDKALTLTKKTSQIKSKTTQLQTWPYYTEKNTLAGWQGRAELRLESADFNRLGQLIGELQEYLSIANVNFSLSPEQKALAEQRITAQAIKNFRRKADEIKHALTAKNWRLQSLNVERARETHPYFAAPMMMRSDVGASMKNAAAPPAVTAGSSVLAVSVNGTVEMK